MNFKEYLEEGNHLEFLEWATDQKVLEDLETIDDEDELEEFLDKVDCPDDIFGLGLEAWDSYLDDMI